jgi:hypothetical protein
VPVDPERDLQLRSGPAEPVAYLKWCGQFYVVLWPDLSCRDTKVAARKGLEPLTFGLGNRCSVLLSYRAGLGLSDAMGRGAAPSPSTKNARRRRRAS